MQVSWAPGKDWPVFVSAIAKKSRISSIMYIASSNSFWTEVLFKKLYRVITFKFSEEVVVFGILGTFWHLHRLSISHQKKYIEPILAQTSTAEIFPLKFTYKVAMVSIIKAVMLN